MEIEIDLKLNEENLQEINSNLKSHMEGKYFNVFSKIFKFTSKINIIVPSDFKSTKNQSSIRCAIGARQGELFFLNQGFIFVPKPLQNVYYKDILKVKFHRMNDNMTNRNIDIEVITKIGDKISFSGIEKNEAQLIINFLTQKKVAIELVQEENEVNEEEYEDDLEENSVENDSNNKYRGKFIQDDKDSEDDEDFDPTKVN